MASLPITRLTEEQYLEIERKAKIRSELFDGAMYAMSGGTSAHSYIKMNLYAELRSRLRGKDCLAFDSDLKVKVAATGMITYPDASIVCGGDVRPNNTDVLVLNPIVLIEVLSPSTEAWDRGVKFHHYQMIPALREYILVSQDQIKVERFVRQDEGKWLLDTYARLDVDLPIDAAGISVPLSEIYHGISFSFE